ncbi:MAG: putative 2OG-Fe(II) oxygenase [Maricaulaceae bacterium]
MTDPNKILNEANGLYRSGNFDAARKMLAPLLKESQHHKAKHLAAMIARDSGDYHNALIYLEDSLAVKPNDHEVLNTVGTIWVRLQDPIRAERAFNAALDISPSYHVARANLAFCHLNYQNPADALPLFEALAQVDVNNQLFMLAQVYALKDLSKNEQALALLDKAKTDGPHKEEFAFLRGQILFEMGAFDEAITANNEAISSPVFGPKAIVNMAQTLHMLGQWPAASVVLERILENEDNRSEVFVAVARVFHMADETEKAENILEKALSKFGEQAELLSFKGRMKADQNKAAEAYKLTFEGLKRRPGDIGLMTEFSRAAMVAGHVPDAMHAAQSALNQQPNNQFWMAMRATGGRLLGTDYKYYFDYEKYVHVYDLDAPEGYKSIEDFNVALARTLENLHNFSDAPLNQSVRIGTQTSPNLVHLDNPILKHFFDAVQSPIKQYMAAIGTDNGHPLTRRNTGEARIRAAWSVKLDQDGHHIDHIHPEGWISSAYYVDVPKTMDDGDGKSGWIRFGQPPFDVNLEAEHFVEPKAGRLVLFPSYMWHGTVPLKQSGRRLTLPFDVLPDLPKTS